MNTSTPAERRRKIAGACLLAAPAVMLAGDLLRSGAGLWYEGGLVLKSSFAFYAAAALGLSHLLRERADRTGLLGAALTLVGCLAGSAIVTAAIIDSALASAALGGAAERAVGEALRAGGVREAVLLYPLPGLAFPVGLFVLSLGLLRARAVPAPAAALLALGAVLFPVGRIGGLYAAVLASDLSLLASMGWVGWRVLNRAEHGWQALAPSAAHAEV